VRNRRPSGSPWTPRRTWCARAAGAALLAVAVLPLAGCFDKPGIEQTWTRVDMVGSNLTPGQGVGLGAAQPVTLSATITYRSILTGFAVAELRASSSISPADVDVRPDAPRAQMATDIDRLLQNSVSLGRATRAVTGWDHLIQRLDFSFSGAVPAVVDSSGTGTGGVFLLCYLGSGVRLELPNGQDSIIVTPFPSAAYKILPFGMALSAGTP
jgi:hypothetical protein